MSTAEQRLTLLELIDQACALRSLRIGPTEKPASLVRPDRRMTLR